MVNLKINIAGIKMKNPVVLASGTCGFGKELADIFDLNILGAIIVKGTTLLPRAGNKPPRVAETYFGMLNSIGLQNPGVAAVIKEKIPYLRSFNLPVIVNISGNSKDEYAALAKVLSRTEGVSGLEVNISCPNIKHKHAGLFCQSLRDIAEITTAVKRVSKVPVFVKLSAEVSDFKQTVKTAERAGADGLSLINTLRGMAIDIKTRRPKIANVIGGLSGPAIKPIGIRAVYEAYNSVKIPIIGMGGITGVEDAVEYMLAGASAVAVGTATFYDPFASVKIASGLKAYLERNKLSSVIKLTGKVTL
ncbi:MAG: dihydroorotate dehydrogenase [Candidatus Firestonebacteria bacterium]